MIADAMVLLLAGMSAVFLFLSLLVICTSAMSRMVMRFEPGQKAPDSNRLHATSAENTPAISTQNLRHQRRRAAAITAALIHHRAQTRHNADH